MGKIEISKNKLKELYENKKLTIPEIARFYNCSTSKVWANIHMLGIRPSRTRTVRISKKDLERLYSEAKLSTHKIAEQYNCGKATIQSRMKKYGIVPRSKSEALKLIICDEKYKILKKELEKLYWRKKLSTYQIAEIYGCSPSAIFTKLKRFGIPRRTDVEGIVLTNHIRCRKIAKANIKYLKTNFNGSLENKAYLIGFRTGDLHVKKTKYGETICIYCCSTRQEQIDLMRTLFEPFGHISVGGWKRKTHNGVMDNFSFVAYLNLSFGFLLDKKDEIQNWILENIDCFLSFLGGYIDAEGSFGIYNGFGSFALGSYDKHIIHQTHKKLEELGVQTESPRIMAHAGYTDKRGVNTLNDLWSFRIRRKNELYSFINLIEPYIRHAKRKRDLLRVKENVVCRM